MDWIDLVIRDLSEIHDRNSPEDQPDMILVTGDEIRDAIERRLPPGDIHKSEAVLEKIVCEGG